MTGRKALTLSWLLLLSCARTDRPSAIDEGVEGQGEMPSGIRSSDGSQLQADAPRPEDVALNSTWTKAVRSAHERASIASDAGEKIEVAESMTHLADETPPGAPTAAAILATDLKARAAQLYLGAARPELAKNVALRALSEAKKPSVGRAQLLMTLADCERALGNTEAEHAALVEALSVNQTLFHKELQKP